MLEAIVIYLQENTGLVFFVLNLYFYLTMQMVLIELLTEASTGVEILRQKRRSFTAHPILNKTCVRFPLLGSVFQEQKHFSKLVIKLSFENSKTIFTYRKNDGSLIQPEVVEVKYLGHIKEEDRTHGSMERMHFIYAGMMACLILCNNALLLCNTFSSQNHPANIEVLSQS